MSKRNWRSALPRQMSSLIKTAEAQGWTVDCTTKGHVRFRAPDGRVVICGGIRPGLNQHHARTLKRLAALGLRL